MTAFRMLAAFSTSILALVWGFAGLLSAQPKTSYEYDAVVNERRLTSVETRLDAALQQLKDIKDGQSSTQYAGYLQLLMLGGLGIEAGSRIRKRKQQAE